MSASRSTDRPRSLLVPVRGDPDPLPLVPAVVHGEVALTARLGPLDRPAELAGDQQGEHFLRGDLELGAEPAAHVRRDHPDVLLRDAGDQGQHDPQHVRDLGGRPQRELAAHAAAHHRARLHGAGDQPLLPVVPLEHHLGAGERRVDVAVAEHPLEALVPGLVHPGGGLVQRGPDVQHRRQRLVVHVHGVDRVRRGVAVPGHHAGHRLAHVADLVGGHRRVRRDDDVRGDRPGARQAALLVGEVRAGERGDHAGDLERAAHVDAGDPGVREWAAHEGDVQHPGQDDVVGPVGLAGDQPGVLLAGTGPAELGWRAGACVSVVMPWSPRLRRGAPIRFRRRRPAGRRGRCSRSRCSGRGCPPALPGSPPRVGSGFSRSRSAAAMIMPGVQYPHCSACSMWNACCSGCHSPLARPSMVVISLPSACTASTEQLLTDTPSRCTVQAPQLEVSHPTGVPVLPTRSLR